MADIGSAGNTSSVKPEEMNQSRGRGLLVLAEGWYRAALEKDEFQDCRGGKMLSMTFRILDGEYRDYRIFDRLVIVHEKEKAQHIARIRLREFATAAGHKTPENVTNTDVLIGKPVMIKVYRAEEDSKYADADGKKAQVDQYLSVERFKAEKADEPMPGVTDQAMRASDLGPPPDRRESKPSSSRPASGDWTMAQEPPTDSYDSNPFN